MYTMVVTDDPTVKQKEVMSCELISHLRKWEEEEGKKVSESVLTAIQLYSQSLLFGKCCHISLEQ
jgi:hypothetical protein